MTFLAGAMPMPPPGMLRPLVGGGMGTVPPPPFAGGPAFAPSAPPGPPVHVPPAQEEEDDAEAPAKRQKVGDVELEPEEEFLAAHPGGGAIRVQLPDVEGDDKMNGQAGWSLRDTGIESSGSSLSTSTRPTLNRQGCYLEQAIDPR